jgi:hypothetical protein
MVARAEERGGGLFDTNGGVGSGVARPYIRTGVAAAAGVLFAAECAANFGARRYLSGRGGGLCALHPRRHSMGPQVRVLGGRVQIGMSRDGCDFEVA